MKPTKHIILLGCLYLVLLLTATTFSQPRIIFNNPRAIDIELVDDDLVEFIWTIANEGNGVLIFHFEVDYIEGEAGWLPFNDEEIQLEPVGDLDILVALDGQDINIGEYEAVLHVISNDPDNGDIPVRIHLMVFRLPILEVSWHEEYGFPNEINWNAAFVPLITDIDYPITITFANTRNNRPVVWLMECEPEMFHVEQDEIVVEAGEEVEVNIVLNTEEAGVVEGELAITSNDQRVEGMPFPLLADVDLRVEFAIPLVEGWNMVSAPVIPINPYIPDLFSQLVENGTLRLVKDGHGRFYVPAWGFCNMGFWDFRQGYQMMMAEDDVLIIVGALAPGDAPINLQEGWNLVAYLPENQVDAPTAFRNIENTLILAKDGWGRFYAPEFDFFNMRLLQRGESYLVNVREDVVLIWNVEE